MLVYILEPTLEAVWGGLGRDEEGMQAGNEGNEGKREEGKKGDSEKRQERREGILRDRGTLSARVARARVSSIYIYTPIHL